MAGYSSFVLIDTVKHFRGRGQNMTAVVTACTPGKSYQIEYHVTYSNDLDLVIESPKVEVGSTPAFSAPGTPVDFTRLDLEAIPLNSLLRIYARINVVSAGTYAPNDVVASFSRDQVLIEGQFCLTSCEGGSCQTTCQASCQYLCELFSETQCGNTCEIGCQVAGGCQSTCQLACQNTMEYYCNSSVETECSTGCEASCQLSATLTCASGCEVSCEESEELSPPGEIDDGLTWGGLLFQFRYTAAGVPVSAGSLFFMGQNSADPEDYYYKIVARDATNAVIAGTPWTIFPWTIATNSEDRSHMDGFQASNGHIWICFGGRSADDTQEVTYLTKSTDLGATWETPEMATDNYQNSDHGTIFEGPDGEIVFGFARVALFGPQEPEWSDPGELVVRRATIDASALELSEATREVLFYLPLLHRDAPDGFFGIGGLRMRYSAGLYYCFYQQGRTDTFEAGAAAVVFAETIETLYESMPFTIMADGSLILRWLDVEFQGETIWFVCEGRRHTAASGGGESVDTVLVISRDGGRIWQEEVLLSEGGPNDTGSGGSNRSRFPMVATTDAPRTIITHVSSNLSFAADFDIWAQRTLEGQLPTACGSSCETAAEPAQDYPTARGAISDVAGVFGRVGVQITLTPTGLPVPFGDVLYAGVRLVGLKGGSLYIKRVPVNATIAGILTKPWTRVITQPAGYTASGQPLLYQFTNGHIWAVQGIVDGGGTRRLYCSKTSTAPLGAVFTAWSLVSATLDATRGALLQDGTGPIVAFMDQTGFVRYKRFSAAAAPSTIAAIAATDLIKDPDKKEPMPADMPLGPTPESGMNTPDYFWGAFDVILTAAGTYLMAYGVGLPGQGIGQVFCLRAPTIDGLRFAQPILVAPERGSIHDPLFDGPRDQRVRANISHLKLTQLSGGRIVCAYDSESEASSSVVLHQAIFRVSYDDALTWQDPVTPYEGAAYTGIGSSMVLTNMPSGLLTSNDASGGVTASILYLNQSSDTSPPCGGSCEVGFEPGGCAASCEVQGVEV